MQKDQRREDYLPCRKGTVLVSNHLLWIYEIRISEAQTRGRELIHDVV